MLDDQLTFVKWIFLSKERLGIASVGWLAARVLDSVFRAKIEQPMFADSYHGIFDEVLCFAI